MKKYCTYLTYYSGKKLPPFYIGSSYDVKIINGYNGTILSKKWKEIYDLEQKENKNLFKTKILNIFRTHKEAIQEELRLQKLHNVVKNSKYFNESYARPNGFFGRDVSGKNNPMFGKVQSEKTKEMAVSTRKLKNSYKSGAIKAKQKTSTKEWKETIGKISKENMVITRIKNNSYETGGKKTSDTKNNPEWKETVGKDAIIKRKITMDKNNPVFKLIHIDNGVIHEKITQRELRKIHDRLRFTSKEKYFGYSPQSKSRLINGGFLNLIGLYIEII